MQMADKYFDSSIGQKNSARGGAAKERIKFLDFGNDHGHLEQRSKILDKEEHADKGRRHQNIRLN